MKKLKYKDRMRYINPKTDAVVTDEPDAENVAPQLSQSEMDDFRERLRISKQDDVLEELNNMAVRQEKAGDEEGLNRTLRRRQIYLKSLEK